MRLGRYQTRTLDFFLRHPNWHTISPTDGTWPIAKRLAARGLLEVNKYHMARLSAPLRQLRRQKRLQYERAEHYGGMTFGLDRVTTVYGRNISRLEQLESSYIVSH